MPTTTTPSAPTTTTPKSPAPPPAAPSEATTHGSPARDRDDDTTWTQRAVDSVTRFLDRSGLTRRSFLTRTAMVGSALAVDPTGLLLRPQSAWASVCGEANECHQGWSAFCATINNGANECPDGSFTAGWWKIDNSDFCSGAARYIVDCNEIPPQGSKCSCRCANGECDRRRVCCNDFRYGQCNTQVAGTTPVVCRVVLCTPPWRWDDDCTSTTLTDNRTLTHWSAALPSRTNPTPITVRWLEMGLVGSVLGDMVGNERSVSGGGSWARFEHGVMTHEPGRGTRVVMGSHGATYADKDGPNGPLGFPVRSVFGSPAQATFRKGHTYKTDSGIVAIAGAIDDYYQSQGGPNGWLGRPRHGVATKGSAWLYFQTEATMFVVRSRTLGASRALRQIGSLPANGNWPPLATTSRWSGVNRVATAAEVSAQSYPDGADTVLVVSGWTWADGTAAGAVSGQLAAPILLTAKTALSDATRAEVRRLNATRAIIVGGQAVVGGAVVRALRNMGLSVARWAGANRHATAAAVSRGAFPDGTDHVVIATAGNFPDSLTVTPLAHQRSAPLLLAAKDGLRDVTRDEIARLGATGATIVGGTSAVPSNVEDQLDALGVDSRRLAGSNRYDTGRRIAADLDPGGDQMVIVTGQNFPDALAAATYATRAVMPIGLVRDEIPGATDRAMLDLRPDLYRILGGASAVPGFVWTALRGYPSM